MRRFIDCFAAQAITAANNNIECRKTFSNLQAMFGGSSPGALAARFASLAQKWIADGPAERAERARRKLLAAIGSNEPCTLGEVAARAGRGAPAVSRSVDSLVRAGLVERLQDPDNRRRLQLSLTPRGREELADQPASGSGVAIRFERLAHSELRAIERAIEILERST
ncbi:MarR family transcriptional regulator [Sphingomonas lutea]|uniref:MarR family transcriptional regulator n=1 Tax=Sphingomonas lutea TaxID=1045317 RepID=A0A7G9SH82_9SPHN|nr:MarR family transcriptional regulator [Sphingomonas lutea]QNN67207.1 MarR family transcriptional regulator [Sphingomonas lutea]